MKYNEEHGREPSKEAQHQRDRDNLTQLRDDIAETYVNIFLPEWESHTHVNPVIERLMCYLTYAISKQLDDFDGWEETQETIQEYNNLFFYVDKQIKRDTAQLSERMQKIKEEEQDQSDEIPF
jgi:hypothetical protein